MDSRSANSLTGILEQLDAGKKRDRVEIGDIVEALQYRGFGPLLIAPALLIFVTGAIPGVPAACGILMALISLQIVLGREHPWLPRTLSVPRKKLQSAIKKAKPATKIINSFLNRRLVALTAKPGQWVTGVVTLTLSVVIIVLGFIPFLPDLLAVPVAFFALGYSARDGLIISLGYVAVVMVALWMPNMLAGL